VERVDALIPCATSLGVYVSWTMRVGLCGFTTSIREYVETFRVVEVQHTFYEPPQATTLLRWREQTGPRFEFTLKAWQLITHRASSSTYRRLRTPLSKRELDDAGGFRRTPTVERGLEVTLACAKILRATSILFQCPASFRPEPESIEALRTFFTSVTRPAGVRFLWEPRGPAWTPETVHALCTDLDLVHVVDPFVSTTTTPAFTYWRLHGLGDHRRPYTDSELALLHEKIDPRAERVYVMFNEIPRLRDAQRFLALTQKRTPSLSNASGGVI
jgi:uncharacterized protein YecE (DUF72 family)